jgi:hypothetical protein
MGVVVGKKRKTKNVQILYSEEGWNGKADLNPFGIIAS